MARPIASAGNAARLIRSASAQRLRSPGQSAERLLNNGADGNADRGHAKPPISIFNGRLGLTRRAKQPGERHERCSTAHVAAQASMA